MPEKLRREKCRLAARGRSAFGRKWGTATDFRSLNWLVFNTSACGNRLAVPFFRVAGLAPRAARRSLCGADRHGDAWLTGVVPDHDFKGHGVSGGNAFRDQDVDLSHSMNKPRGRALVQDLGDEPADLDGNGRDELGEGRR